MKLIKKSDKTVLEISRDEWLKLGQEQGWVKEAQSTAETQPTSIDVRDTKVLQELDKVRKVLSDANIKVSSIAPPSDTKIERIQHGFWKRYWKDFIFSYGIDELPYQKEQKITIAEGARNEGFKVSFSSPFECQKAEQVLLTWIDRNRLRGMYDMGSGVKTLNNTSFQLKIMV